MPSGLLLCDDLLFVSRITGEARALGLTMTPARSVEQLLELAGRQTPPCVVVDLAFPGLVLTDLFRRLGEVCHPLPRVVAYGSHVDADSLRRHEWQAAIRFCRAASSSRNYRAPCRSGSRPIFPGRTLDASRAVVGFGLFHPGRDGV